MSQTTAAQGANQTQAQDLNKLSYLAIQQSLLSKEGSDLQELQDKVENNYSQLSEDIRATALSLRSAKKDRINILKAASVDWIGLGKKDAQIESLRKGLAQLKEYRTTYFPAGTVAKVEDEESEG